MIPACSYLCEWKKAIFSFMVDNKVQKVYTKEGVLLYRPEPADATDMK